jgi:hypothetical protein
MREPRTDEYWLKPFYLVGDLSLADLPGLGTFTWKMWAAPLFRPFALINPQPIEYPYQDPSTFAAAD